MVAIAAGGPRQQCGGVARSRSWSEPVSQAFRTVTPPVLSDQHCQERQIGDCRRLLGFVPWCKPSPVRSARVLEALQRIGWKACQASLHRDSMVCTTAGTFSRARGRGGLWAFIFFSVHSIMKNTALQSWSKGSVADWCSGRTPRHRLGGRLPGVRPRGRCACDRHGPAGLARCTGRGRHRPADRPGDAPGRAA